MLDNTQASETLRAPVSVGERQGAECEIQGLRAENQHLKDELARLQQIIRDVRSRDAGKRCLCRGQV